jgi:hypothetical protein
MMSDLLDDFEVLGRKLLGVLADLDDPDVKASGSDAASLARCRRVMGAKLDGRLEALRDDYELLGDALGLSSGSGAASVAQERRMIRQLLDVLEEPEGVAKVDELASFRAARAEAAGTSRGRRRKSG